MGTTTAEQRARGYGLVRRAIEDLGKEKDAATKQADYVTAAILRDAMEALKPCAKAQCQGCSGTGWAAQE